MRRFSRLQRTFAAVAAAALFAGTSWAQCPLDDSYEDNDVCGAFATLPLGLTTGLVVHGNANPGGRDDDYWLIQGVPTGYVLTVDALFSHAGGNIDLQIHGDAACSGLWSSSSTTDNEQVTVANGSGAAKDFYLVVAAASGSVFDCNDYSLQLTIAPDPCQQVGLDDGLEENDSCAAAVTLAAGTYTGLFVSADHDYYRISVPSGEIASVATSNNLFLVLFDDPACTNQVGSYYPGSVQYGNPTGAAVDYYLLVLHQDPSACSQYDLSITLSPAPWLLDDSYEDNDTCGSASLLPVGLTTGLVIHGQSHQNGRDDDYWLIQGVPSGQQLTVDVLFSDALGDIDAFLFDDAACSVLLSFGYSSTDNEHVAAGNASGATKDYYLQVTSFGNFVSNDYSIQLTLAPDPCHQFGLDDSLEENDDCASAVPISDGLTTGLFVSKTDPDSYELRVDSPGSVMVHLSFAQATADVDVYLYDDPNDCGDTWSNYLTAGYTATNDENIFWNNNTGSLQTLYLQVVVFGASTGDCNTYDLQVTGTDDVLATPFCFGDGSGVACPCANESALGAREGCKNSLGYGARLSASGSASVVADDLAFTMTQARANQPSMLVQGEALIGVPFKDGVLCMGNPTERVEVVILDANGAGTTASSIVTEGNIPGPGATRYYQQWYRDPGGVSPCGTGSNFSNGLIVTYN